MSDVTTADLDNILADAKAAPPKVRLEEYREAVETLREKGYSWREVADFLTQRGVATDHTRIYRHFGEPRKRKRRTERKPVDLARMTFVGEKPTKKNKKRAWKVFEIELPSKLGSPIILTGHAWGTGTAPFALGAESSVPFRQATLVTRTGDRGFPLAYIEAELETESGQWAPLEIYIVPKWEALL